jgi:hypothetical protein
MPRFAGRASEKRKSVHADYGGLRLIALGVEEGWLSGLYDLKAHKWIHRNQWAHETVEAAQEEARQKAEVYLNRPVPALNWR